jgi:hypothetical protein
MPAVPGGSRGESPRGNPDRPLKPTDGASGRSRTRRRNGGVAERVRQSKEMPPLRLRAPLIALLAGVAPEPCGGELLPTHDSGLAITPGKTGRKPRRDLDACPALYEDAISRSASSFDIP